MTESDTSVDQLADPPVAMLDPSWTPAAAYAHALQLLSTILKTEAKTIR